MYRHSDTQEIQLTWLTVCNVGCFVEEPFAVDHPSGGTLKRATPPDTPPSHPKSIGENWPEQQVVQDGSSDTASDVASPSVKPLNFASVPVSESVSNTIIMVHYHVEFRFCNKFFPRCIRQKSFLSEMITFLAKIERQRLTKIMFELNIMSNKSYDKFSKWEKLNFVMLETGIYFGFIEN